MIVESQMKLSDLNGGQLTLANGDRIASKTGLYNHSQLLMASVCIYIHTNIYKYIQWIGLRENLQENPIFDRKICPIFDRKIYGFL